MITFEQALVYVQKKSKALGTHIQPLEACLGSVLAENIRSDIDMPPFDKSAMDGYAVRSIDLKDGNTELSIAGEIKAGDMFEGKLETGKAARIMTGAPLPAGADAVVKVEDTRSKEGSTSVLILQQVKAGANICQKGEDISLSKLVLKKNKRLNAADIAVLASVGRSRIKVYQRPRIAIIATGDELVEKCVQPIGSQIRDSNRPMLKSYLSSLGYEVADFGIVDDKSKALSQVIVEAMDNSDILILTGGVSMGDFDLVPRVLGELDVKQIYHNVWMKPGKPQFFGRKGKKLIFGFPGNPVSSLLSARIFVQLAARQLSGEKEANINILEGYLEQDFNKKKGRKTFYPVRVRYKDSRYHLAPLAYNGSADIMAVTQSDGMMILDGDRTVFKQGEKIQFIKW